MFSYAIFVFFCIFNEGLIPKYSSIYYWIFTILHYKVKCIFWVSVTSDFYCFSYKSIYCNCTIWMRLYKPRKQVWSTTLCLNWTTLCFIIYKFGFLLPVFYLLVKAPSRCFVCIDYFYCINIKSSFPSVGLLQELNHITNILWKRHALLLISL